MKYYLTPLQLPPPKIPKPPSGIRGSSAYNLFCSNFFQSGILEVKCIIFLPFQDNMRCATSANT